MSFTDHTFTYIFRQVNFRNKYIMGDENLISFHRSMLLYPLLAWDLPENSLRKEVEGG